MTTLARNSDAICYDETTSAISAYGPARSTIKGTLLSPDELGKIDAYWRATLYLSLGMLYLKENPLLRKPLKIEQTKPRLLGHWGSDAGQSFTCIHLNRLINKYELNAIFVSGPGHGAPAVLSNACLEGTYSEICPEKSEDLAGMQRLHRFSLAIDAIDRMPRFQVTAAGVREALLNQQIAAKNHAHECGIDRPDISNWQWPF